MSLECPRGAENSAEINGVFMLRKVVLLHGQIQRLDSASACKDMFGVHCTSVRAISLVL